MTTLFKSVIKDDSVSGGKIVCWSAVSQEEADRGADLMARAAKKTMDELRRPA